MGTGRTYNKQPLTRPKKKAGERRRRVAVQRKRLVALGMDEEVVGKLNTREIKDLLKRPKQLAAKLSQ